MYSKKKMTVSVRLHSKRHGKFSRIVSKVCFSSLGFQCLSSLPLSISLVLLYLPMWLLILNCITNDMLKVQSALFEMVLKYRHLDPLKYLIDQRNQWGHSLPGFSVLMKHQGHRPVKYWIKQGPHTFQTGTVVSLQIKQYHFIIVIIMMPFLQLSFVI